MRIWNAIAACALACMLGLALWAVILLGLRYPVVLFALVGLGAGGAAVGFWTRKDDER